MASQAQTQLLEELAGFTLDPLSYIYAVFPWGEGELEDARGPYTWQAELLADVGKHLQNPKTRFHVYRAAIASGHGIGKSACVAFLTKWGLGTCEDCKIIITANTGTQLATKTSPEIAKWFRLALDSNLWDVKATSVTAKEPDHAKTWRADLIPWTENNSEAFAGLHNKRKRIIIIFDEASAISDIIWDVIQGALTDEETEILFFAFGNPTQNQGRFSECFGSDKARWRNKQIDSRTVQGTNKAELEEWVTKYGEDSDYIRVRVRGEFPRGGSAQFIPGDLVTRARNTKAVGYEQLPKILSCDVARFGDDETVIAKRQGRRAEILATYRGQDTVQTAERLIEFREKERPDAVIVDGDGIGGAVVDHLRNRGYRDNLFEFHGGTDPTDPQMWFNKRAEVWGKLRNWLEAGAQIPDDADLARQLTSPTYFTAQGKVRHGSIALEHKDDLKKRGMPSPDKGDALAMTFAVDIATKRKPVGPAPRPASSWS